MTCLSQVLIQDRENGQIVMRRVPPDRSVGKLCAGLPRQGFHHCGDQFLQTAPLGDASGVSDVCAGYALWDLR